MRALPLIAGVFLLTACGSLRTIAPADVRHLTSCETQFVDAAESRVRVCDEPGPGRPLVLLHGLSGSLEVWEGWANELKGSRRIIRLDLPGFGLTGPRKDRNYSIEKYAEVIGEVLAQRNVDEFDLAGNSLGGYIAWYMAKDAKVKHLILLAPIGLEAKPLPVDRMPWLFRKIARVWTPPASVLRRNLGVSREIAERYYDLARLPGNRGAFVDRLETDWHDHTAALKLITAKTLILWGSKDQLRGAERFEQEIRGSKRETVDGLGHLLMEEDPKRTAEIARKFLDGEPR